MTSGNILIVSLLLLFATSLDASHFRGASISWAPNLTDPAYYPSNYYSSTVKVHVTFHVSWRRSDGASHCTNNSIANCQMFNHDSLTIYYGYSESSQPYSYSSYSAGFYCVRYSVSNDFTIGTNNFILYLPKQYHYKISTSSCCWIDGLLQYSSSSWNIESVISFKPHPSYYGPVLNTPPRVSHLPLIQHLLNPYSYNSYSNYTLPVSDPDRSYYGNDEIRCRWAANFSEGGGVWNSRLGTLNQNCNLTLTNYAYGSIGVGWYALAVMVEDFAYSSSTGYWGLHRISSTPVQFTVQVYRYNKAEIFGGDDSSQCSTERTSASYNVTISSRSPPTLTPITASSSMPIYSLKSSTAATVSPSSLQDGCMYYQVLSHGDRASTYNDWSSYRCDGELYGWYRFMGQAGNRMLNHCPNTGSSAYNCGSYYQGWIPSGSLPAVSQGSVSRYVCFSRYGTCSCSYSKSIFIKNCGTFYVYWLDGVPSCNARYCGVKDNSAKVHCSQNYMRIDLDRTFYNTSLFSKITLKNQACTASYSSSYITLGSVPGACGAVRKDTANHIVYENEVILKGKQDNSVITRNLDQSIVFSCSFSKNGFVSHMGYKPIYKVNATEKGYGNFSFSFWMYTNRWYTTVHSVYPVTVQLRDFLYFEIHASVSDSNVVLLVDQCYATPTMDRNSPLKYIFIDNRCPTDPTTKFTATDNYRQRFNIQAFRFLQNSTAVFFHCLVFLCHKTSTDSRCRYGCTGNNVHRGKREVSGAENNEPSKMYLLEMEIRKLTAENKEPEKVSSNWKHITAGSVVAVCLALVIAGMAVKMRKLMKAAKVAPASIAPTRYATEVPPPTYENNVELTSDKAQELGIIINPKMEAKIFK